MSERINVLYRRIDERSKQATVLPAVQARIANRAVHLSKLLIQQLQVVDDEGIGSVPEGLGDELDSFIKALQDVEDAMIATEQSGFLTRLLSAMWVNARLATAQEGLESAYKQLVTAIRTSAQSTAGPVDLPPYSLVGKTPSAPTDVLDSARPKWSDVELLASLTTRRPSDQSSSWASVFTAKVAGVRGTVMVKTYPGKRRDALARLQRDIVLLNLFQSDVTPTVVSFSAETSQTPFIIMSGGAVIPFGDYLQRVCEIMPSQARHKAWNLIADILRVAPFLHTHVKAESLWAMIQPGSLVVAENQRPITSIPPNAALESRKLPPFHPLDVDLNEVLRNYFAHDLGLRPLRTLDIFASMRGFEDRSNPNRPPPPPVVSKFYFISHPDPEGTLTLQGCFPGDFGRFARGPNGNFEFIFITNPLKTIEIRLPSKAPKDHMNVENVERGLIRASFPAGLTAIREQGDVLNLYLRKPGALEYHGKHGYRLSKEHRAPPWAWAIVGTASCRLPLPSDVDTDPCYLFLQLQTNTQRARAYWTLDPIPDFSTARIPAKLQGFWYSQREESDFAAVPQAPTQAPKVFLPSTVTKSQNLRKSQSQFDIRGPSIRERRYSLTSEDRMDPLQSLNERFRKPESLIFTARCTEECEPFCDYPHALFT